MDTSKMTISERIEASENARRYRASNSRKLYFLKEYEKALGIYLDLGRDFEVSKDTSALVCLHFLLQNKDLLNAKDFLIVNNLNRFCMRYGKLSYKQCCLIKRIAYAVSERR